MLLVLNTIGWGLWVGSPARAITMQASAGEFVDFVVGEEVVLGGRVGTDRRHPGTVRALSVELAESVPARLETVAMFVAVVVAAVDSGVLLVCGAALSAPFS